MRKPVQPQTLRGKRNFMAVLMRVTGKRSVPQLANTLGINYTTLQGTVSERKDFPFSADLLLYLHLTYDLPIRDMIDILSGKVDGRGIGCYRSASTTGGNHERQGWNAVRTLDCVGAGCR